MTKLQTKRLQLIPLTLNQLQHYITTPYQLEQDLQLNLSREIITDRVYRAIEMKISKMKQADLTQHLWFTYWLIVIKEDQYGAGLVGFKGIPNNQGVTEIGYGIDSTHRNKGYMTEAVKKLIEWAFKNTKCKTIIAPNTQKANIASNTVLKKARMYIYGETEEALNWKVDKA